MDDTDPDGTAESARCNALKDRGLAVASEPPTGGQLVIVGEPMPEILEREVDPVRLPGEPVDVAVMAASKGGRR